MSGSPGSASSVDRSEGITHVVPYRLLPLWRKVFCVRNVHAFDEVAGGGHYLVCDACQLVVHIAAVDHHHVDGAAGASLPDFPRELLEVMTPEQAAIWWDSPQVRWAGATPRVMSQTLRHDEIVAAATAVVNGDYF